MNKKSAPVGGGFEFSRCSTEEDQLALAERHDRPIRIDSGCLRIELGPGVETCLVKLAGDLDLASVPTLESEVDRLLAEDLRRIVLDLGGLEFIDSAGIQCLLVLSRRSNQAGDALRMLEPDGEVDRMLLLTGVREVLPLIK